MSRPHHATPARLHDRGRGRGRANRLPWWGTAAAVLAAVVALVAWRTAAAAPKPPQPPPAPGSTSSDVRPDPGTSEGYWTPERMREARPAPMPEDE
ncbi:hypothetical protein LRS74_32440 [Streptomyces sp. LX-29]|uniref:hypothetical protein n=1 Tax=Streptomyces sp. LX-29 TaxID=2900152 RepID=UPI00240DB977|nr:hypothetical protein [Streptomyces sp. LX-29]WFB11221.1 hypothetical protein LRS74_32440 [Streptomyces sp. LX-29]